MVYQESFRESDPHELDHEVPASKFKQIEIVDLVNRFGMLTQTRI